MHLSQACMASDVHWPVQEADVHWPVQEAKPSKNNLLYVWDSNGGCPGAQDSGTAIWLFAYFGYWLEIIIVLSARAARGTLLSAIKKRPGRQGATLPALAPNKEGVTAPGTPPSPDAKVPGSHPGHLFFFFWPSVHKLLIRSWVGFGRGIHVLRKIKFLECHCKLLKSSAGQIMAEADHGRLRVACLYREVVLWDQCVHPVL